MSVTLLGITDSPESVHCRTSDCLLKGLLFYDSKLESYG